MLDFGWEGFDYGSRVRKGISEENIYKDPRKKRKSMERGPRGRRWDQKQFLIYY